MIENNDHLLEALRKRQDEYQAGLRQDSWEKLEATLASRRAFRMTWYRWVAVAAAILLAIVLSVPLMLDKGELERLQAYTNAHKEKPFLQQQTTDIQIIEKEIPSVVAVAKPVPAPEVISHPEKKKEKEREDTVEEKGETVSETTPKTPVMGPEREKGHTTQKYLSPPEKERKNQAWGWGLSAGSNSTSATSTNYHLKGSNPIPPINPPIEPGGDWEEGGGEILNPAEPGEDTEDTSEKGNSSTKSMNNPGLRNETQIIERTYHHRLPISIGISANKRLSDNFALETGLTYTFLHSDISEKGVSGYIGEQKLHYLGVPLKASWLFYNQGRFSVYLSGGALFEYCISAGQKIRSVDMKPDVNRFQFSLGAAAGAQIALVKPLSLFVEPGVSYYFDPGGGIETIRTEKPFMFNLQVGIRFTY